MVEVVLRREKSTPLTSNEADNNFENLKDAVEAIQAVDPSGLAVRVTGLEKSAVYFAATKAAGAALAASLPNGATVIVEADESQGGVRVRYTVASAALTAGVVDTAAMAKFTQAGTGAVARTAQDKLAERITPEDHGAAGDGVATDTTSVTNALSGARALLPTANGQYLIAPINIVGGKKLFGLTFTGLASNADTLRTTAAGEKIKLIGVDLSTPTGIAFHQNTANNKNILMLGCDLYCGSTYALLSNQNSDGLDGFLAVGSAIKSETGDGIEWNHPNGLSKHVSAVGCLIDGAVSGAAASAGFGVGVAGTQGHITVGNHIRTARQAAVHVEDKQKRGVIGLNTAASCTKEFMILTNEVGAEPLVMIGNSGTHTGAKTSVHGSRIVSDARGLLTMNVQVGNMLRGFGIGYRVEGAGLQVADNNVSAGCDFALSVSAGTYWLGTHYSSGCTDFARAGGKSVLGKLISDTHHLAPLTTNDTVFPKPYAKGIFMPFAVSHPGGDITSDAGAIFTMPRRMFGRITVVGGIGSRGIMYSATIKWDGTTLTLTDVIDDYLGTVSAATLVVTNGKLTFRFFSSTSLTIASASVDFEGVWYAV